MSRMLKNTCLFAEYRSLLYVSFAKETYIFKHPTNRSHPITMDGCANTRCAMGWLRSVGSLQLQVSLENIGLFCKALLQKRPII